MTQTALREAPGPQEKQTIREAYGRIRSFGAWRSDKSPDVPHDRVLPFATYSPWLNDAAFLQLHQAMREHTLVDLYRCYELWTLATQMATVEGAFLEVGVWRGGTGALLAAAAQSSGKAVYLADTFTGVVKAGALDTAYVGGEHADTSADIVRGLVATMGLPNVTLLQGIFPDDTGHHIDGPIAMLHCDVDVYTSAREVVQWALPRLSRGGCIVFDDYGFLGCEGVTRYVNELRSDRSLVFVHNLNGHAVFIKT